MSRIRPDDIFVCTYCQRDVFLPNIEPCWFCGEDGCVIEETTEGEEGWIGCMEPIKGHFAHRHCLATARQAHEEQMEYVPNYQPREEFS